MPTTYKELLAAAHAAVPKVTPAEAAGLVEKSGALIVDVRDGTEVAASGKVKGAVAVAARLAQNPAPIRTRRTTIRHSAKTIRSFCIAPAADAPRWQARRCATWDSRMSATSAASRIGSRPAARSNRYEVTAPRSAGDFLPRHERQQQHQQERRRLQHKIAGQRV